MVSVLVEDRCQLGIQLRKRCNECLVLSDEYLLSRGNFGSDGVVCRSRGCNAVAAGGQNSGACDTTRGDKDCPTAYLLFESHRHTMAWVFARLNAGRLA